MVQSAEATGLTSLSGTLTTTIDATGATPASITTGTMSFDVPLPTPVPSDGVALAVPSTPATVGPFTATSADITVSEDAVSNTTDIDGDGIGKIALELLELPERHPAVGLHLQLAPGPAHGAGHRHGGTGHAAPRTARP